MKYICPHCQMEYDISECGKYQCRICDNKFEITIPQTVTVTPAPVAPKSVIQVQPKANICPFCKMEIPADAKKCGHCGEWKNGNSSYNLNIYKLLSFYLGHIGIAEFYAGNSFCGIVYAVSFSILLVLSLDEKLFLIGIFILWAIQYIGCCIVINSRKASKG